MKEIKPSEITVSELKDLVAIHYSEVELKENEATQRLLNILKPVILKNARLFSGDDHEKIYAQTYPNPDSKVLPREMRDELIWAKRHSFIGEKTKIVSLGSCFAKEIAKWLQRNGFRYITTDSSPVDADGIKLSSAGWGLFSIPLPYIRPLSGRLTRRIGRMLYMRVKVNTLEGTLILFLTSFRWQKMK